MTDLPKKRRSRVHSFDIDKYLNPFIPRPRFHYLPRPLSYLLGYRPPGKSIPSFLPTQQSNLNIWIFSFVGAFIGIAIIENVYLALPLLSGQQVPIIIASFGAAAILEYNTIESPLAQPRNLIAGHFLSSVIGVGVTKLFLLLPPHRFEELRWLAGAISVAAASAAMSFTKTVHPPAGATALIAATSPDVTSLGWWLLALILLGCSLMLASALIVNNLYRRFPIYWWTPVDLTELQKSNRQDDIVQVASSDIEKGRKPLSKRSTSESSSSVVEPGTEAHSGTVLQDQDHHRGTGVRPSSDSELTATQSRGAYPPSSDIIKDTTAGPTPSSPYSHPSTVHPAPLPGQLSSDSTSVRESQNQLTDASSSSAQEIIIRPDCIIIPERIGELNEWEREVLEVFMVKLKEKTKTVQ